jgi:hypothetical protein
MSAGEMWLRFYAISGQALTELFRRSRLDGFHARIDKLFAEMKAKKK